MADTFNNERADRINHHLAEVHREIAAEAEDGGIHVLTAANLGETVDEAKDAINRMREVVPGTSVHGGRPLGVETREVDGIEFSITRTEHGSTVDSPCGCLGIRGRLHSTTNCPWRAQREAA